MIAGYVPASDAQAFAIMPSKAQMLFRVGWPAWKVTLAP
jgi:hypothetical protein